MTFGELGACKENDIISLGYIRIEKHLDVILLVQLVLSEIGCDKRWYQTNLTKPTKGYVTDCEDCYGIILHQFFNQDNQH